MATRLPRRCHPRGHPPSDLGRPTNGAVGWPLLLLAVLLVAGVGAATALRRPGEAGPGHSATRGAHRRGEDGTGLDGAARRRQAVVLLLVSSAGYFLALGSQGQTGPLFRWAYFHLPFFPVMREPQKFLMSTALAYAVLLGWGVERLGNMVRGYGSFDRWRRRPR